MKPDMEHEFSVTGTFHVSPKAKPVLIGGNVCYFKLPNNAEVRLIVGLEVEKDGKSNFVTRENEMRKLGFSLVAYDDADWAPGVPVVDENEVLPF